MKNWFIDSSGYVEAKMYLILVFIDFFYSEVSITLYVATKYKIGPSHNGREVFQQSYLSGSSFFSDLHQ